MIDPTNALLFCELLTQNDKDPDRQGWRYSLPTTIQWQFFAGDTRTNGAALNYGGGSGSDPREISDLTEPANPNQLCDVFGNFSELCSAVSSNPPYVALGGDYATGFYATFNGPPTTKKLLQPTAFRQPDARIGFRVVLLPVAH